MRVLMVSLLVALLFLQGRLWFAEDGLREVWRLEQQVEVRTAENRRLDERNFALEAEVDNLKEGLAAAEERARSELGMIRRGETFYQIAPARPAAPRR
jgi:cell division protein FtsB